MTTEKASKEGKRDVSFDTIRRIIVALDDGIRRGATTSYREEDHWNQETPMRRLIIEIKG